jgi:hypothetical protein
MLINSKSRIFLTLILVSIISIGLSFTQDLSSGRFSGGFEINANLFLKDSTIGAFGFPQYERELFGGESWMNLNYNADDFSMGVRFDMYNNSNLRDPDGSFTGQGLARWFVKKKFDNLTLEVGNLYDQIGSGIIYRAYEMRPLFIDNSLLGASVHYDVTDNWFIKGFAGRQRNAFDLYGGNVKGIYSEAFFSLGEENPISFSPGFGFVAKTISEQSMSRLVNIIRNYIDEERFNPYYNSYAFSAYNTLSYGDLSWYIEGAYKYQDAFFHPFIDRTEASGATSRGRFTDAPGYVISTTLSYNLGPLTLSAETKRVNNFGFRMEPDAALLRGLISYIPPMNRQNTFRLPARYAPAIQEASEQAYAFDLRYKFSSKLSTLFNFSDMKTLEGDQLFREYYTEVLYKPNSQWQITLGLQLLKYNQEIYEEKPLVPMLEATTPFFDILYKIDRKKSVRFEFQYMNTQQDFGSWLFGLIEFGIAPKWIFEVSGMYNFEPKKVLTGGAGDPEKIFYPTVGLVYIKGTSRMQFRYVKQVEGVVCSGGICRLEPAFSGMRFSVTNNF